MGSSMIQSCMTEKFSGDGDSRVSCWLNSRILRAYFRKRVHSVVIGSLLKDFCIELLRRGKQDHVCALTVHPPPFQTSPGKVLSNGSSRSCLAHSTSSTGSSKPLQQHAKATAVPSPLDATSSWAMSLKISSRLRQGCIESRRCVWPCIDGV